MQRRKLPLVVTLAAVAATFALGQAAPIGRPRARTKAPHLSRISPAFGLTLI